MRANLAACRETAEKLWQLSKVLYVFEHKTLVPIFGTCYRIILKTRCLCMILSHWYQKWSGPTCCCSVCTQVVWSLFCRYKSIYYGIWLNHFTRVYKGKYCHFVAFIFIIHIYLVLLYSTKYSTATTFVIYSPGIIRFNCKLFNPFLMLYCIVIVYMLYIVYIDIIMVGD